MQASVLKGIEMPFVNIKFDKDLLKDLDEMVEADMVDRSKFIRRLVAQERKEREYDKKLVERRKESDMDRGEK